jgi:hypothetical protein
MMYTWIDQGSHTFFIATGGLYYVEKYLEYYNFYYNFLTNLRDNLLMVQILSNKIWQIKI